MAGKNQISRKCLKVSGQVQGVGFRPFVYRLAVELHLSGFVLNDAQGVTIEVQGRQAALSDFVRRLQDELPPLAEISRCDEQGGPGRDLSGVEAISGNDANIHKATDFIQTPG